MTPQQHAIAPNPPHRLRSGTAARLAGLPVTTLRVWERRYGVVAADKTESGQRTYSAHDVARLRLLRQLTHAGHAIGTIATRRLEDLQALAAGLTMFQAPPQDDPLTAVAIGRSAAHALEQVQGCVLGAVHDDLDQAESMSVPERGADLLVVRLASLQPASVDRVLAFGARLRVRGTLVIYGFGTIASAQALSEAGVTVRRDPFAGRELARWVRDARQKPARVADADEIAPRRFTDEQLGRIADMPSPVSCECLRHMAELVTQIAGFERYSQDCTSTSPSDAALHRQLSRTAGIARTMFEKALQQVMVADALEKELEPRPCADALPAPLGPFQRGRMPDKRR